jgi:hypothetical protein
VVKIKNLIPKGNPFLFFDDFIKNLGALGVLAVKNKNLTPKGNLLFSLATLSKPWRSWRLGGKK